MINIKLKQETLKNLANQIIKSGITSTHSSGNLMNMDADYFHWRLKDHFPSNWDLFLKKHGARFVGFIGEYVIKTLKGIPFEIKLKGDEGKDILIDDKWWDIKTGFSSLAGIPANAIRHPETYGYIFCCYTAPDSLLIMQYDTADEVFRESNFKAKGTALKYRDVKFDCYMPTEKRNQNIEKFLNLSGHDVNILLL